MEEIQLNMKNLTKEEREHLIRLVEKANKKGSKIWKPEDGDTYYFIDSYGDVYHSTWGYYVTSTSFCPDDSKYAFGNCFKTKEEAEFALERRKVIAELERFAKENNNPNSPADVYIRCYETTKYNEDGTSKNVTGIAAGRIYGVLGTVAFSNITIAENAVQTIGEDRLKRYYFGIKE